MLQGAYAAVHPSLNSSPVTLTVARLAMSFAVLIVPSALMGATLPLVVKSSLREAEGLGGRVGVLYATNTAGAIAGSLVAGLVLIPRAGIRSSFLIAAAVNGLVAVTAVALGRRRRKATAPPAVRLSRGPRRPAMRPWTRGRSCCSPSSPCRASSRSRSKSSGSVSSRCSCARPSTATP